MDDALIVEVLEALEYLADVDADEGFGDTPELRSAQL
jgi:hypothetical protein